MVHNRPLTPEEVAERWSCSAKHITATGQCIAGQIEPSAVTVTGTP